MPAKLSAQFNVIPFYPSCLDMPPIAALLHAHIADLPGGDLPGFLDRIVRLNRLPNDELISTGHNRLDIDGGDMRMTDMHIVFLAGSHDVRHGSFDLRMLILTGIT